MVSVSGTSPSSEKSSVLIFAANGVTFLAAHLAAMFVGCGTRYVRILGDHYYMVSFDAEKWTRRAILKAASVPSGDTLAADDWVPTKNGLFVRYIMADDLKQPRNRQQATHHASNPRAV